VWLLLHILIIKKLSRSTPRRPLRERSSSYSFSTSALEGELVVSVTPRPRYTPGEGTPDTHCTGGWIGPRAGLDTEATGQILSPLPGIEPRSPGRPARSQTLYWLSYPAQYIIIKILSSDSSHEFTDYTWLLYEYRMPYTTFMSDCENGLFAHLYAS
jgi:hypothetical protein